MFKSIIPWKKRKGNVAVKQSYAPRVEDDYALARLRDEFDSLMNGFLEEFPMGQRFLGTLPSLWSGPRWDWSWNADWKETEQEYVLQAELPGFEPEEFAIQVSGNLLTVRAEHKEEKEEKSGGASYRYGSLSRSVTLPHGVDASNINARYHSGVLEVCLPKTPEARGRRIDVQSG